jgi:hypothetical protein
MSATRLHRLSAIGLTALYGVVGLTGESLHYLVTDPTVLWSQVRAEETVVYYHSHGPGDHGHFHRHSKSDCEPPTGKPDTAVAFTSQQSIHQSHECPILTVVSTLKLGHASSCATPIILDAFVTPSCEGGVIAAFDVPLSLGARGPPSGPIA